jgi:hypothetical protein
LELFECIEGLLRTTNCLTVQTETTLTPAMTETVAKIMAELLSVFTLATKQVNEGQLSMFNVLEVSIDQHASGNYAKELLEQNDVGVVLQRLARLTQEEARVTFGLILEVIYGIISNMTVVMEGDHIPFGLLHAYR